MKNKYIFSLLIILLPLLSFSQSNVVVGEIIDEDFEPLVGVNIKIKNTKSGTVSDSKGKFKITAAPDAVLMISYIGFVTLNESINGRTSLKLQLSKASDNIDEVVVVGFSSQKKLTGVGGFGQLKGKELLSTGVNSNMNVALQGQLPGLVVVNTSSRPGLETTKFTVRGPGTFNGAEQGVLTLIDGIERDFTDIDANEVESFSLFKDAAATAIYGIRGANGVLLITTKRGTIGKPKIQFTANYGIKQTTTDYVKADVLTSLRKYNEALVNDGDYSRYIPQSTISAWEKNIANAGPNNDYFPNVNWWDETVGNTGSQSNYNVNISGGSKYINYFTSVGYTYEGDVYKTNKQANYDPSFYLKRYNWRSNLDIKLTNSTTLSLNIGGKLSDRGQAGYRLDGGGDIGARPTDNLFGEAQFYERIYNSPSNIFPIKYSDGSWGETQVGDHNLRTRLDESGSRNYRLFQGNYDITFNQKLDFLVKGLRAQAKASYNSISSYESAIGQRNVPNFGTNNLKYFRTFDYSKPQEGPGGETTYPIITQVRVPNSPNEQFSGIIESDEILYDYTNKIYLESLLEYEKELAKRSSIKATFLYFRNINEEPKFNDNKVVSNAYAFSQKDQSWIGRVNYNFRRRYSIESSFAINSSDKFSLKNRYARFYSVGANWNLSEEKFFNKIFGKSIDELKIRGSYGESGNEGDRNGGRFDYLTIYGTTNDNLSLGSTTVKNYGPTFIEKQIANEETKFETEIKRNIGVDFKLFKKKLSGSVDFFADNRNNISIDIISTPWAPSGLRGNVGKTKKHGYEFDLKWASTIGTKWSYSIGFNSAWFETRVVYKNEVQPTTETFYSISTGKPIGNTNRYISQGFYKNLDEIYNSPTPAISSTGALGLLPGDISYSDVTGNGRIDLADQAPMLFQSTPQRTFGLNLNVKYKGFALAGNFYAAQDVFREIPDLLTWDFNNGYNDAQINVNTAYSATNTSNAQKPLLRVGSIKAHSQASSTLYTVDASYIRLKNLSLTYDLPKGIAKSLGLNNLQVSALGNNVWTITDFDNRVDPEGDARSYPIVARYTMGVKLDF